MKLVQLDKALSLADLCEGEVAFLCRCEQSHGVHKDSELTI